VRLLPQQHAYRGEPRIETSARRDCSAATPAGGLCRKAIVCCGPDGFPIISERERTMPEMSAASSTADLELLLRRIIREEAGVSIVPPADKWRGGALVLRPGTPGLQEKSWPIETFFHKIVMLRNRLRTLEQHINAAEMPDDIKVKLQAYITGCYGSLTSFNVLFSEDEDQFKGTSSD
jgi:hypothetical protein